MHPIIAKAKKYCTDLLMGGRCAELPFHSLEHTIEVYESVLKIGRYENWDLEQLEPILLAALFHDTGNSKNFGEHEEISACFAETFLKKEGYDPALIAVTTRCIMVTKLPQNPVDLKECIICDADLHHLGEKKFYEANERLRAEWEQYKNEYYSDRQWYSMNIDFLHAHNFHTPYGRKILEPVKRQNIRLFELFISNSEYE